MTQAADLAALALSKVGDSYVYGAEGPNTFDCSGLVDYCFKTVGVHWSTGGIWQRLTAEGYRAASVVVSDTPRIGDAYTHNVPATHIVLVVGANETVEAYGSNSWGQPDVFSAAIDDATKGVVARGLTHRRFAWVNLTGSIVTPGSLRYGVDYSGQTSSWGTFFAQLKASGRDFVGRYLPPSSAGSWPSGKEVTAAEITAAAAAEVDMYFYWESTTDRARTSGYAGGVADATSVAAILDDLGVPATQPVYYCVDESIGSTAGAWAAVDGYFQGLATVVPVSQIGMYGGFTVGDYLLKHSRITYFNEGWDEGLGLHPLAQLSQVGAITIAGMLCDKETAYSADFGQYREGSVGTPPRPVTPGIPTDIPQLSIVGSLGIGGIRSNDDLVLVLKASDDSPLEFRGQVWDKQDGLLPTVTLRDASAYWDRTPVGWVLNNVTLGQLLTQIVANPSGQAPTGYIPHVAELKDENDAPITFASWSGLGKNLSTVLSDFQKITGARWCLESRNMGTETHFWWGNPADPVDFPDWSIDGTNPTVIRDDIDPSLEDDTQLRVMDPGGEIHPIRDNSGYANRVTYTAKVGMPPLPSGVTSWDALWTDSLDMVTVYDPGTVSLILDRHAPQSGGQYSLRFEATQTVPPGYTSAINLDLGYITVPPLYADMSSPWWGFLVADTCFALKVGGVPVDSLPGSARLQLVLHSGAYPGPFQFQDSSPVIEPVAISSIPNFYYGNTTIPFGNLGLGWTTTFWPVYGNPNLAKTVDPDGNVLFDPTNIQSIQLRLVFNFKAGQTYDMILCFDDLMPYQTGTPSGVGTTQYAVELPSVTYGIAQPLVMSLQDTNLSAESAYTLANAYLAQVSRTKVTVPNVVLSGIRPVPLMTNIPLELYRNGITGVSYPPVEILWSWGDAGDTTTLTLGDTPKDDLRLLESLWHHLDRMKA